ncbi:MAG: flagellar filament outer layer protein FlaA [Spirochaetales bacterium]|nr:flagellar filament outer layer protein FlaA [Spirochaetales bacterium]
MKRALILAILVLSATLLFAQQDSDPESLGRDTAQQQLQEVSISKFEDSGFWRVYMPIDQGLIESRRFEGSPIGKELLPEEEALGIATPDDYVLGVKASFFRRGNAELYIQPIRPLQVPGITKTISMWVVGRNFNHRLNVVVADYFGNVNILDMGKLNFSGWKRMTVAVPPTIVQRDYHYNDRMGLQIIGFMIEPDLMETYGTYYVYFDDLRVYTDLFAEESRDPDDMVDSW